MLDNSNEPANTVTHPAISKHPAQQASRGQQCDHTELPTSTLHGALDQPERIL